MVPKSGHVTITKNENWMNIENFTDFKNAILFDLRRKVTKLSRKNRFRTVASSGAGPLWIDARRQYILLRSSVDDGQTYAWPCSVFTPKQVFGPPTAKYQPICAQPTANCFIPNQWYRWKAETLEVCLLLVWSVCDQTFGSHRPLKDAEKWSRDHHENWNFA